MRGEYWHLIGIVSQPKGSPPLARGILIFCINRIRVQRITPACAGNTVPPSTDDICHEDHPRLRGEYIDIRKSIDNNIGSPPLARGIPCSWTSFTSRFGITPACAGNTSCRSKYCSPSEDHPRLRGEYGAYHAFSLFLIGSPPLARGIPLAKNSG